MPVKQRKDGTWLIESGKDLERAVEMIEEREESVRELEQQMEEEYDYLTMQKEIADLTSAVTTFMSANDVKHVFRDSYKITCIKGWNSSWNPDKLKALVPKSIWLKITTLKVDPDKINDLVTKGVLDDKKIEKALESKPKAAYIQRYPYKEGQDEAAARAEEDALRKQLSGATEAAAPKPKKRGKK